MVIRRMDAIITDDSKFMVENLKNILSPLNFENIYTGSDGSDAVSLYQKYEPDIVLLDVVMGSTDGVEALREIMDLDSDATVVMISAVGQEDIVEEAKDLGAEDFISKPFDNDEVRDKIKNILDL